MTGPMMTNALRERFKELREELEIRECSECGRQYYDDPGRDEPLTCEDHL